jgi:chromosome segregation ATPase
MGEIKQANFRLDEESVAIFRKYCEEQKINHAKGFDHLLEMIKIEQSKNAMPDRKTDIDDFECNINKLLAAYRHSLEINANAEQRVQERFTADISRRDRELNELKAELDKLKTEKETAEATAASAVEAKKVAEKNEKIATDQAEALKKSADDQERIIAMLNANLAEKEEKLTGYADLVAAEQAAQKKTHELEQALNDANKDHVNEIKALKKDAEMEQERAITAKERELSVKVQEAELKAARLAGKLEMLEARIKELTTEKK